MNRRILLCFLILLTPAIVCGADFSATVIGVSDGDTITVLRDRTQIRIRLHGIDAPESGQDFGSRAKQAASDLAFGKLVTVRPRDTDRYGRTVAEVVLPDGRSLNREMVREGMAWWYREYAPKDSELARLETEAKENHRGLWSQTSQIPPWNWRKGDGTATTVGVIGNRKSHLYHLPYCRIVFVMKESNRITFATAEKAEAAGYRKAGDCQ
jgi:endonuclease YncB( thermonuclease family)